MAGAETELIGATSGGGYGGGGGGAWGGATTDISGAGNYDITEDPNAGITLEDLGAGETTTSEPVYNPYTDPAFLNYQGQIGNVGSTADTAAGLFGTDYGLSITDYVNSLGTAQTGIDNSRISNLMAKQQGASDIRDMVGRGIRSGNTLLASRNAGDSSAAGAIARAYGNIGNRQMGKVGNQFAEGEREADDLQAQFVLDETAGAAKLKADRDKAVTGIVEDAKTQLASIESAMLGASLPDVINLQADADAIRQSVVDALAEYDTQLSTGRTGVSAMTPAAIQTEATKRANDGKPAGKTFDFQRQTPAQFQGQSGFAGNLPLFTYAGQGRKDKQA